MGNQKFWLTRKLKLREILAIPPRLNFVLQIRLKINLMVNNVTKYVVKCSFPSRAKKSLNIPSYKELNVSVFQGTLKIGF